MACAICLDDSEELIKWECGQEGFCKTCSLEWIVSKIKESIIPGCIHGCSDHVVSFNFVEILVEEDQILEKAKYIYLESEIPTENRIYCANCTIPLNMENHNKKVNCIRCLHDTCMSCKLSWSDDHICESKDDQQSLNIIKEAGYQICKCGLIIERVESCNKIFCKCKRVFCYKCNTDYSQDGQSYLKMCSCNDYDEDVLFIAHVDNIFTLLNQETMNSTKFKYSSWNRQVNTLTELIKYYKSKTHKKEEILKLQKKIMTQIMMVSTVEISVEMFNEIDNLPLISKLKQIYKIIQENRNLKNEVMYLRQQITSNYFELSKAKKRIRELEESNSKKQLTMPQMPSLPIMPLFPMLLPVNIQQAFTLTTDNLPS